MHYNGSIDLDIFKSIHIDAVASYFCTKNFMSGYSSNIPFCNRQFSASSWWLLAFSSLINSNMRMTNYSKFAFNLITFFVVFSSSIVINLSFGYCSLNYYYCNQFLNLQWINAWNALSFGHAVRKVILKSLNAEINRSRSDVKQNWFAHCTYVKSRERVIKLKLETNIQCSTFDWTERVSAITNN